MIHIKKIIFFLFLIFLSCSAFSQPKVTQQQAQNFLVQDNINKAVAVYAQLAAQEPMNTAILQEYAYALALAGLPEIAIMYLDKVNLLGGDKHYVFFVVQTLRVMGYGKLASGFWDAATGEVPSWILPYYQSLRRKHQQAVRINRNDNLYMAFTRADTLAANGMWVQTMVLLQDIIDASGSFFPYISRSILWEKMGKFSMAAQDLEKGIAIIKKDFRTDTFLQSSLPAFEAHRNMLNEKQKAKETTTSATVIADLKEKYQLRNMLYVGGMYSKSFVSFNSRVGVFTQNSFSAALDCGVSGSSDVTYFNIGASGYERYKFLVGGAGFNWQFGGGSVFNFRLTGGLSIPNKTRSCSTDIFITADIPFSDGASTTFGISFGRTFYFGKRGK